MKDIKILVLGLLVILQIIIYYRLVNIEDILFTLVAFGGK